MTALVFGVVFLAELPDKTALAGLVLGTRYRASYVFAGVAAAFALHVVLAVAAGSVLTLLPQQLVHALTGVLFLGGAAVLLMKKGRTRPRYGGPRTSPSGRCPGPVSCSSSSPSSAISRRS